MSSNESDKEEKRSTWSKFRVPSFKKKEADASLENEKSAVDSPSTATPPERKLLRHKSEFLGARKTSTIDENVVTTDTFDLESSRRRSSLAVITDTPPPSVPYTQSKGFSPMTMAESSSSTYSPPVSFLDRLAPATAPRTETASRRASFTAPKAPISVPPPPPVAAPASQPDPSFTANHSFAPAAAPQSTPTPPGASSSGLLSFLGSFEEMDDGTGNGIASGSGDISREDGNDKSDAHSYGSSDSSTAPVEKFHHQSVTGRVLQPSLSTGW
jgi:hypothetical protein